MATSKLDVISQAYNMLGQPSPADLTTNPRDVAASTLYDRVYRELLAQELWYFARTRQELVKIPSPTLDFDDYKFAYTMPTNPAWLRIMRTSPIVDFKIFGDVMYARSNPTLDLDYVGVVAETTLPEYFVTALVLKFAASISMLITQQPQLAQLYVQEAQRAYLRARTLNYGNEPTQPFIDQPVYDARFKGTNVYGIAD